MAFSISRSGGIRSDRASKRELLKRAIALVAILWLLSFNLRATRAQTFGDPQPRTSSSKNSELSRVAILPLSAGLKGVAPDCLNPKQATGFEECAPKTGQHFIIGEGGKKEGKIDCTGIVVFKNGLAEAGKITINSGGVLELHDESAKNFKLKTSGIEINDGGTLQIGNSTCPIGTTDPGNHATITFVGSKIPDCKNNGCSGSTKGIEVASGGSLKMYGAKGVPTGSPVTGVTWTYLGDAAGPFRYDAAHNVKVPAKSDTQIVVKDDVEAKPGAWQANDWIAVAGTSFSPFETEFVKIAGFGGIDKNGNRIINLSPSTPLRFYHFGSLPPTGGMTDGTDRNYGVDERAEVALISRNIKLTSHTPDPETSNHSGGEPKTPDPETSEHWGGELKFLPGFTEVSIQGVEIEKFGKDKLGSYPVHFHMDGDLSGKKVLFNANSIHHSYNKCIALHSTSNLTISNNVCARIVGTSSMRKLVTKTISPSITIWVWAR